MSRQAWWGLDGWLGPLVVCGLVVVLIAKNWPHGFSSPGGPLQQRPERAPPTSAALVAPVGTK